MSPRRDNRSYRGLTLGFAASVVLHLLVIVPVFLLMISPREEASALPGVAAQYSSEDVLPAPEQEPPEPPPQLGLDAPNPSSLTWIGYEEYREHLAALEEFEQAAFTQEPVGGEEAVETLVMEEPTERVEEAPEFERLVELPGVMETAETPDRIEPAVPEVELVEAPEPSRGAAEFMPLLTMLEALHAAPIIPSEEAREHTDQPPSDAPTDTPPSPQPTEDVPPPAPTPGTPGTASPPSAAGEPADAADKESVPTSIIEVPQDHWRLGKPLAAQGIELKPQRPRFSIVQLLTASPGNPLVDLRFRPDGVPALVTIVRGSGVDSVDSTLIASLYRWRASGAALDELEDEQTFTVRIHIILNRRR